MLLIRDMRTLHTTNIFFVLFRYLINHSYYKYVMHKKNNLAILKCFTYNVVVTNILFIPLYLHDETQLFRILPKLFERFLKSL